jgi:rhamnose transport system permease protein
MIGRYQRELSVAVAFALLLAILAIPAMSGKRESSESKEPGKEGKGPAKPSFFESSEPRALVVQSAPVLLAAVGMTLVILARHIDISIGSQFSLCAVAAGLLARAGLPMPLVAVATLLTGAGLGAVNGALVAGLGLPSIVVTLATLVILRDGLRWWREGEFVKDLPSDFQWFGLGQDTGQWLVVGLALAVFLATAWGLRHLAAGRAVYATGSDPEAARLVGIRPRRVVFTVFVVMGALAGLAALLSAVQLPQVDPKSGDGLELQVIAAVVVGGVAISGGRGTLVGTLLGVALLGTIRSALVFLGAEAYWEKAVQGGIILIAVASDALNLRKRKDAGTGLASH